jgi:hypothetical protein
LFSGSLWLAVAQVSDLDAVSALGDFDQGVVAPDSARRDVIMGSDYLNRQHGTVGQCGDAPEYFVNCGR